MGIENMLNRDAAFVAPPVKVLDRPVPAVRRQFRKRHRHRARLDSPDKPDLLFGSVAANGFRGDLVLNFGDNPGQLGEQFTIKSCIQRVVAVPVADMGVNAASACSGAGQGRRDCLGNGFRQGGMVGLFQARTIGRDHDVRQWRNGTGEVGRHLVGSLLAETRSRLRNPNCTLCNRRREVVWSLQYGRRGVNGTPAGNEIRQELSVIGDVRATVGFELTKECGSNVPEPDAV